jgi:hypothetical protein
MPAFRNVTADTLWVVTDRGLEKCEPESVLTVSDAFAEAVYFQTGETGEPVIWEAVVAAKTGKKDPAPTTDPADAPSN